MLRKYKHPWLGHAFILPSILGFSLFVVYPMVSATYFSMTNWMGFGGKWKFIGFENYLSLFNDDPIFYKSLTATFLYVLYTVPVGMALSLGLSVMLNKKLVGGRFFRTAIYVPVIVPSIAALIVWKFAFNPDYGLINNLLGVFGVPGQPWLEDEILALPSISVVALWGGIGSTILIFLSGLQSVSPDIYEAAEIDGASPSRKFWMITVPMITPVLFLQLITGTINAFQQFNAPAIMTSLGSTKGGPNFSTYLLSLSIYDNALDKQAFGYGMAQVWVLFVMIMLLTVLLFRFTNAFVFYESESK